jgi:uncharacterized protein (DUF3084 family)
MEGRSQELDCDTVSVSRSQLDQLVTEVMQMREFLPKVLGQSYIKAFTRLAKCEEQLLRCRGELESVRLEKQQLSKRSDSLMAECELDKEVRHKDLSNHSKINHLTPSTGKVQTPGLSPLTVKIF